MTRSPISIIVCFVLGRVNTQFIDECTKVVWKQVVSCVFGSVGSLLQMLFLELEEILFLHVSNGPPYSSDLQFESVHCWAESDPINTYDRSLRKCQYLCTPECFIKSTVYLIYLNILWIYTRDVSCVRRGEQRYSHKKEKECRKSVSSSDMMETKLNIDAWQKQFIADRRLNFFYKGNDTLM
jgi:hypothetical protein